MMNRCTLGYFCIAASAAACAESFSTTGTVSTMLILQMAWLVGSSRPFWNPIARETLHQDGDFSISQTASTLLKPSARSFVAIGFTMSAKSVAASCMIVLVIG